MNVTVRRWATALLTGLIALGASAPAVNAQFRPGMPVSPFIRPAATNPAFQQLAAANIAGNMYNLAVLGRGLTGISPFGGNPNYNPLPYLASNPYLGSPALTPTLTTNPYGYAGSTLTTNPYGSSMSTYNPNSGYLGGTADVASGDVNVSAQTARLIQTQADDARIEHRRRLIDEARYERGLLPTSEELRQADLRRNLDRATHEPPISDIISARSLNDILDHLRSDPALAKGPDVRIPEGVLDHVNVISPNRAGSSLGLLKDDGKLQWPTSLSGKEFEAPRLDLSNQLAGVVQDLKFSNPVEPGKIKDLSADLDNLRNMVEKSDLSPTNFIEARDYLDQVGAAVSALKDPNVAALYKHKFSAKNVAELVDGMKGLNFGPAAPGDEWAYKVLSQALVAYNYGVSPPATPAPAANPPSAPAPEAPKQP